VSTWRLIDSGPAEACFNMALDEALALCSERPVFRLYGWERPAVSIGCFQKAEELDLDYLSDAGIPMVRRITGGRGILHGHEVTYSFSAPASGVFSGGLRHCYTLLGEAFARVFSSLGLAPETSRTKKPSGRTRSPLCFQSASLGEIKLGGRKVVGSAQKRWPGRFMQQGSIPLAIDYEGLSKIFMVDREAVLNSMTGLLESEPSLTADSLKGALISAFEEVFGARFTVSGLMPEEEALAERLLLKYRSPEWNINRLKAVPASSR
jgi:lipoate-protein ligase A